MEDLKSYFESTQGVGVLSTANAKGEVNAAVFSRPHFMEDGSIAFIMPEKLTYANLLQNSHAHYLFHADAPGYSGKRLSLVKTGEEKDTERLFALRKREGKPGPDAPRHLVFFRVDRVLPLIGTE